MIKHLNKFKCHIDAIYYCLHQIDSECLCSKPKTCMIDQDIKNYKIDRHQSYLIGNKMTDILVVLMEIQY